MSLKQLSVCRYFKDHVHAVIVPSALKHLGKIVLSDHHLYKTVSSGVF